jgi:hypothetical protein
MVGGWSVFKNYCSNTEGSQNRARLHTHARVHANNAYIHAPARCLQRLQAARAGLPRLPAFQRLQPLGPPHQSREQPNHNLACHKCNPMALSGAAVAALGAFKPCI